jgi:hypothetical protein
MGPADDNEWASMEPAGASEAVPSNRAEAESGV